MRRTALALRLATRYFFVPKRFHSVQVVSVISSITIGVVVMAAVCVLSIFNGYEEILLSQVSVLDAPLLIERNNGQTFASQNQILRKTLEQGGKIEYYSFVLRGEGVARSIGEQQVAYLYGVDSVFAKINNLSSVAFMGNFTTGEGEYTTGVLLYRELFANHRLEKEELSIYVPKRKGFINPMIPNTAFRSLEGTVKSVIEVQNEHYDKTIFLSIEELRTLLDYEPNTADGVLLLPRKGINTTTLQKELQKHLGKEWRILDRMEQQPELMRLVSIEKWMSFLILLFIFLLATFNVICSASMLILEKKHDMEIFALMGATPSLVRSVFLWQGLFVSLFGAIIGLIIGSLLVFLQASFGLVTFGGGVYEQPYPVDIRWDDMLLIIISVLGLGFGAAYYPVHKLLKSK